MATWMGKFIEEAIARWLVTGVVPQFSSPTSMSGAQVGRVVDLSGGGGGPGGRGRGVHQGGRAGEQAGGAAAFVGQGAAERGAGGVDQDWHKEMPSGEYVAEWQIPGGRGFFAYFGGPNAVERLNILPKVTHHRSGGRPAPLCLRYPLENVKCTRGNRCGLAHIRPRDLRRADHDKITAHLRMVYASSPQPMDRAEQPVQGLSN
jgi:hypothetical protein